MQGSAEYKQGDVMYMSRDGASATFTSCPFISNTASYDVRAPL